MTATKLKPTETIGNDLPILTFQTNRIMKNCQYQVDTKNEWVQWVTADVNRTSLKSITQEQARKIIMAQEGIPHPKPLSKGEGSENWGLFDKNNKQHLTILAQMRTAQWVKPSKKWGEVPDLERLSEFLKSDKSPIKKPLKQMQPWEVSKIIEAMKGIVKSIYK